MESTSLLFQLQNATKRTQLEIGTMPLSIALQEGELPLSNYVAWLRVMAILHGAVEHLISDSDDQLLGLFWTNKMGKRALIESDLDYFENQSIVEPSLPCAMAVDLVAWIRGWHSTSPAGLIGCLYALEWPVSSFRNGHGGLADRILASYQGGNSYVRSCEETTEQLQLQFEKASGQSELTPIAREQIVETAMAFCDRLGQLISTLYPTEEPIGGLVGILNPDAGLHPITHDPREVLAALDAGEESWRLFPYYELRYGERGRRFTRSDSAWLVSLCTTSQSAMDGQIRWLSRLLAGRGMPQVLMESHLEILYKHLVAAVPNRRSKYQHLLASAKRLADERTSQISSDEGQQIITDFEQSTDRGWAERLPHSGMIIVSAVADYRNGIDLAVSSLKEWLADVNQFPLAWTEAVQDAFNAALSVGDKPG